MILLKFVLIGASVAQDNIYTFQDYHRNVKPDPCHQYTTAFKESSVPLIIDNGLYKI